MRRSGWLLAAGGCAAAYGLLRAAKGRPGSPRPAPATAPRVVVLGGGFAGKCAVETLAKRGRNRARILLIDRRNYHLFTPMLYQAATCTVVPSDTAYPLRQSTGRHSVGFRRADVRDVDFNRRVVVLDDGEEPYDYLVIALGSSTNFFGNDAARRHSLPLKQLEEGIAIRNRVVDMLEKASETADAERRASMLTFVIVGGGATGVETAGALADMLRRVIGSDYPGLNPRESHVVVVDAAPKLLGHMSSRIAAIALRELRSAGVDVRLNAKAESVEEGAVKLSDGDVIRTQTVIWVAGVEASETVAGLDAPHGPNGSLAVDEYLQVRGRPGVYAVGDNAHIEDPRTGAPLPLLAAAAEQEGRAVARNIASSIAGRPRQPFHYVNLGNVLNLGRSVGAALIGGVLIDGVAGWLAWRLVHLARITSYRNKLATLLDWTVGYLYDEDTARLEVEPNSRVRQALPEPHPQQTRG